MNTFTILAYGSKVQLTNVDMYGFCGRDNHPQAADVGFLGVVVANFVDFYSPDGDPLETKRNVLGGTELADFLEAEEVATAMAVVCYKVRGADGRELELMNHEIEEI